MQFCVLCTWLVYVGAGGGGWKINKSSLRIRSAVWFGMFVAVGKVVGEIKFGSASVKVNQSEREGNACYRGQGLTAFLAPRLAQQ